MTTYEIRDITIGRKVGTVEANTERGAKIKAAREFNLYYAWLAAYPLEAETANDNQNGNMMTSTRKPGAIVRKIDTVALLEKIYPGEDNRLVRVVSDMFAFCEDGKVAAIIGVEGVGEFASDDVIDIYVQQGWSMYTVEARLSDVMDSLTDETADLADIIRVFGSRLESNHATWFYAITGKSHWSAE